MFVLCAAKCHVSTEGASSTYCASYCWLSGTTISGWLSSHNPSRTRNVHQSILHAHRISPGIPIFFHIFIESLNNGIFFVDFVSGNGTRLHCTSTWTVGRTQECGDHAGGRLSRMSETHSGMICKFPEMSILNHCGLEWGNDSTVSRPNTDFSFGTSNVGWTPSGTVRQQWTTKLCWHYQCHHEIEGDYRLLDRICLQTLRTLLWPCTANQSERTRECLLSIYSHSTGLYSSRIAQECCSVIESCLERTIWILISFFCYIVLL